jgi:predicted ATPase
VEGLFERGSELDELDAQVRDAAAGQGHLVVVEGPAGIGKIRLLAEARMRADGSVRALSARGSELEREFAFGVVRQLSRPSSRRPSAGRSCSVLRIDLGPRRMPCLAFAHQCPVSVSQTTTLQDCVESMPASRPMANLQRARVRCSRAS